MRNVSKNHGAVKKRTIVSGKIYIRASFNNIAIDFTDYHGNVQMWSTSGHMGFKGAKKSTPHAAQIVAYNMVNKLKAMGVKIIDIILSGSSGSMRDSAVRCFVGFTVLSMQDVTGKPHNGCRSSKKRKM